MRKLAGVMILTALLILSGCSAADVETDQHTFSESSEISIPENNQEYSSKPVESLPIREETTNMTPRDATGDSGDLVDKQVYETVTRQTNEADQVVVADQGWEESEQEEEENVESSSFQEVIPSSEEDPQRETDSSESTEPEIEDPPNEEPVADEPGEPELTSEPEPDFDIGYWINFANELAESKGLRLDPSANDCWDNPITANPDCIYLQRDLDARLSRYASTDDITDVWIWYEDLGDQHYLIYIGYA